MRVSLKNPPRVFSVGLKGNIKISDCGTLALEPNEQITFLADAGSEYDVVRKDWGFYATPSINKRLLKNNFFAYIVQNRKTKFFFIMIVNSTKSKSFLKYIKKENLVLIPWPKKLKYQKILK